MRTRHCITLGGLILTFRSAILCAVILLGTGLKSKILSQGLGETLKRTTTTSSNTASQSNGTSADERKLIEKNQIEWQVRQAFRDSAYLYEKLKPIYHNTLRAYEARTKESNELQLANSALRSMQKLQEERFSILQKQVATKGRFQRWLGRFEGAAVGVGIGVVIGSLIL